MAATYQYEINSTGGGKQIVVYEVNNGASNSIYIGSPNFINSDDELKKQAINSLQAQYPGVSGMTLRSAPYLQSSSTSSTTTNQAQSQAQPPDARATRPFDSRLIFVVKTDGNGAAVFSLDSTNEYPLIDGMVFNSPDVAGTPGESKKSGHDLTDDEASKFIDFYGVPSIMNPNSYINLQAAGGKGNNKYLIDRENQVRWYNATEPTNTDDGSGPQMSTAPTVPQIIEWSSKGPNLNKFPYRYTDFVFCKWWKKIPNNYMITLRRYPFPVNDSVSSGEEGAGTLDTTNLKPVSTMITFLGEEPGNKLSSIVGPIETGLKWKDLEAKVWDVDVSQTGGDVNNPAPGIAKFLGFLTSGGEGVKEKTPGPTPPDPYQNGPYANKIIGPVNVITTTKMRDQGLEFKHSISLVFEYSLRSIGGINTKVAGLDILSNAMLMSTASASFWGGANRFVPNAGFGRADPFLGGPAGKAAWMRGNPDEFFNALKTQFAKIGNNINDVFGKIFQSLGGGDPLTGLQNLAKGGAAEYMKMTTAHAKQTITGLHSLLTGAPVGEWHLTIGSPMNPIMMMGNMVCSGAKIEFSDELGPDDFPAEVKVTVTLEHGMPRDRDGIESMFNKGRGRIYSLPKGYENSFASSSQSPVDVSIPSKYAYQANLNTEDRNGPLRANKDVAAAKHVNLYANTAPTVASKFGALYGQGYGYSNSQANAKTS